MRYLTWRRLEVALLIFLCVALPLYEAPKNAAWLAYTIIWSANRARSGDFGGTWDLWDTLISVWIASVFVVAAFAGLHGSEWRGALDLVRYGGLLWMAKRGRYTSMEMRWVLYALFASVVIGLVVAANNLLSGKTDALELNSVGHFNHTSIYIAILLGAAASWFFADGRAIAAGLTLFLLACLIAAASRGAIGAGMITLLALGIAWWPRSRRPLALSCAVIVIAVALALGTHAEVIRKQEENAARNNVLSNRGAIWGTALAAWRHYPVFGVGVDNYNRINASEVRSWGEDPSRYFFFSHAHSLYLNTLAERGIAGAAALAAVLATWLFFLVRYRPRRDSSPDDALFWGCAASAWLVTVIGGTVNTTLHHEHGILAALFLGLWLARLGDSAAVIGAQPLRKPL
jgi:O-antigen ligase